ncbi:hypothetical protein [Streptomyces sp. CAU 1734]|uniref:hypothetical protein n=1 Tax=Streptomyces sp. CAU 1734 TaxID=3140360 RepID=UPI0032609A05
MIQTAPEPTDPAGIAALRGVFSDGYTADDINRVFGIIHDVLGQRLVCRWEFLDEGCYRGSSEFYFENSGVYYYDGGIYGWLNGSSDAPLNLGDPLRWRGGPVPDTDREGPQRAATEDGFHNCVLFDKNA